ncbi:SH3 domain-containing protein [Thermaerobacter sp. PB12/4term]|uniref:SH3 domain-containing protein n=1 Tax=Thermaerobacter sp. PB12/4term TaxID=2293838 RepID=UPI000E328C56|nr:SH3 domain-containing protein [Thermaerobacter sp. PB12/4term]QIA27293.1 SH3 domain-containing protein [Thermaerobacter sp. PB12/4term]
MERLNRLWVVVAVLVVAFMAYSVGGWLNNVQQTMTTVDDLMVRMTQLEAQQAEISAALAGGGDLAAGWSDQGSTGDDLAAGGDQTGSTDAGDQAAEPAEPQASTGQTATVTTQYLNVRAEPTQDSTRVGTLAKGSTVQILEEQDGWARVRYQANGRTYEGWVDARYLQR